MKKSQSLILMLLVGMILCGCSTGREILTLKNLSDVQKQNQVGIDKQDHLFENLLALARKGNLDKYRTEKDFQRDFGAPILNKFIDDKGGKLDRWLYRYSTKYFDSPKVYVFFDEQENFVKFELAEANEKSGKR
ncbi:MAG: hypothetical protein HQL26_08450 [Candidatus Omnitrophica bacterium]|nr:hypothetical protein [Candidatus Omnitrophota bacterium]